MQYKHALFKKRKKGANKGKGVRPEKGTALVKKKHKSEITQSLDWVPHLGVHRPNRGLVFLDNT